MDLEQIEIRMNQISELLENPESNLEELEKEIRSLKEQKSMMLAEIERRKAEEKAVIESAKIVEEFKEDKKTMELREFLNDSRYINEYAEYIKSGNDKKVRALFTELVDSEAINETDGIVPVPTYLAERINTAWEKNELARRIPKTYFKGVYKEAFELYSTGASIHEEGAEAPAEQNLQFGVVTLNPISLKKWIKVSDEVLSLKGRAFLDYLFDEIEYHISKLAVESLLGAIVNAPTAPTESVIAVPIYEGALDANTILNASALLAEDANPIVVCSRATYAQIKGMTNQIGDRVNADPFNGYEVVFANVPNDCNAILLDPTGARFNFPDGDEIKIKVDDLSLAEYDLVKIVGRQYVGIGMVKPYYAVKIVFADSSDDEGGSSDGGGK